MFTGSISLSSSISSVLPSLLLALLIAVMRMERLPLSKLNLFSVSCAGERTVSSSTILSRFPSLTTPISVGASVSTWSGTTFGLEATLWRLMATAESVVLRPDLLVGS